MASREDPPKRYRTESEPSGASGGHLSADEEAGGPLFDPLFAPLPSELAGEPGLTDRPRPRKDTFREPELPSTVGPASDQPQPWEETELLPPRKRAKREPIPVKQRPRPALTRSRRKRGPLRRVKRTITHIDPLSVLKMSLLFYAFFFVVWLLFAAILYNLIAATGVLDAIADIVNAFGDPNEVNPFELTFGVTMKWAIILGALGVFIGSLINAVLAFLYNVANDVVGGVQVTFSERDE